MLRHKNLDIDVLRTFILGFELGSFARAADRVGRSRSAISAQLRKLEKQIGQPLVAKAGRGLALTDAGENLLSFARRIVELNDQAVETMRGSDREARVRLGLPQDCADAWLHEVLERFACTHPDVRVEVRAEKVSTLVERTLRGELDFSLVWGRQPHAPIVEHIADIPLIWVGAATKAYNCLHDAVLPLLAFEPPCAFREPAVAALDMAGIEWRVSFASPNLSSLWAAAAAGRGIAVRTRIGLPANLMALDAASMGLPVLSVAPLCLVRGESEPAAAVRVFGQVLLGVVRNRLDAIDPISNDRALLTPATSL